jgi:hypothetical protein
MVYRWLALGVLGNHQFLSAYMHGVFDPAGREPRGTRSDIVQDRRRTSVAVSTVEAGCGAAANGLPRPPRGGPRCSTPLASVPPRTASCKPRELCSAACWLRSDARPNC